MKTRYTRFFTISDWMEEEEWLREQSKRGLKLKKVNPPAGFVFEEAEPQDVVYKLDYKNTKASKEMKQMYQDYGWEYCGECFGWNYYRKPADQINSENEGELFSDNESKLEMVQHIFKTRMMPLVVIFLCCVVPNLLKVITRSNLDVIDIVFTAIFGVLFVLYIYIFIHCGTKLRKIKEILSK